MAKDFVEVKVLDLPGVGGGCACSNPSLSPEYAAMLQQKVAELKAVLEENYPGRTGVEYVDLREHPAEKESELGQLLVHQEVSPSPGGDRRRAQVRRVHPGEKDRQRSGHCSQLKERSRLWRNFWNIGTRSSSSK